MVSEFFTTTGLLRIRGTVIIPETLIPNVAGTFRFHSFVLAALLLYFFISRTLKENPEKWMSGIVLIYIVVPHVSYFFRALFVESLKKRIDVLQVKEAIIEKSDSGLEEYLTLRLPSRRKKYRFRVHEKQLEPFLQNVLRLNPSILVSI